MVARRLRHRAPRHHGLGVSISGRPRHTVEEGGDGGIEVGCDNHEQHSRGDRGVIGAGGIRDECAADREMTMSNQLVRDARHRDPYGWRAGTVRVLANALLVLLAFEAVSMVGAAAAIVAGATIPSTPVELVPGVTMSVTPVVLPLLVAGFLLVRWIFVLPGLLPVLVGLEYVARRARHARVLTAIVAFAPTVLWELSKSPGGFPSETGAVLGMTAVLFAVVARLPARPQERSTEDRDAAQPPAGTAVASGR